MMSSPSGTPEKIRVMLVDDSAIIRSLISRELRADPRIDVVSTASDGEMAINSLKRTPVDVVLLDIEMPVKDGLEALPELKTIAPESHVIMVSTLTQRNAKISLQAMQLGASDYLAKPSSSNDKEALKDFYRELKAKVYALGDAKAAALQHTPVASAVRPQASAAPVAKAAAPAVSSAALVSLPRHEVLAIASSTGGPQALVRLLGLIGQASLANVPVFITQHMPPTFTALLADHIRADAKLDCREAKQDEVVEPGRVYLAPGDFHMLVKRDGNQKRIVLNQDAPVNFCRPAADPMFESILECYGKDVLALVLTGMGSDGCAGADKIKQARGHVLIQDKESSVVWGMPGAVAAKGFQDAILTLDEMALVVKKAVR